MKSVYKQQKGQRIRFKGWLKKLNKKMTDQHEGFADEDDFHPYHNVMEEADVIYRRPQKKS